MNNRTLEFASTAEEYLYPPVKTEESRFRNLLATRNFGLEITTIAGTLKINLSPENRLTEQVVHVEGTVSSTQFSLSCNQGFLSTLLGDWFSPADFSEMPDELKLGVFEAAIQPALDVFFTKTGTTIEFSHLSVGDAPAVTGLSMGFSTENKGLGGEIAFAKEALPKLLNWCGFLGSRPAVDIPDVPVPVRIRVASAQLTESELRSLEAGDIIFLDWHGFDSGCFELNIGGKTIFEALVEENRLVMGKQLGENGNMSENGNTQANGEDAAAADTPEELLFRLYLELPEKSFYTKALLKLQPGQVITRAPTKNEYLLLRLNDAVIAQCELLSIATQPAARLFAITERQPALFAPQDEEQAEPQAAPDP